MVEFSDYFDGEGGRVKQTSKEDKDILKALEFLMILLPIIEYFHYNSFQNKKIDYLKGRLAQLVRALR